MTPALLETNLPLPCKRGKVRDVYDLGEQLLIVATDRISAFDVVLPTGIPDKGRLLTAISLFWFEQLKPILPNHLISAEVSDLPKKLRSYSDELRGRFMLTRKARVVPIECVARGYLAGSGWSEYQKTQSVCGIRLPEGLRQCLKLPTTIFTPATKADTGHDENISFERACDLVGTQTMTQLRELTLKLYESAAQFAKARGIIIADTKFEFGFIDTGELILIDEALTPDSSRFWPAREYEPGHDQASFDKQFVRNYLASLKDWNKTAPGPVLPTEVVVGTRNRYIEAFEKITGKRFAGTQKDLI